MKVSRFSRIYVYITTRSMSTQNAFSYNKPIQYSTCEWMEKLHNIPNSRLNLAQLPTPVHEWKLPGLRGSQTVLIKRDDLTGSTLSGNKVRKLEFVFAEILRQGCRHVITCGGEQSNHCRATAVISAQLGIKCHLFLRSKITEVNEASVQGNMLLNRLCGADMYFIPKKAAYETHIKPRMMDLAEKIKKETGEESYLLPIGASNEIGFYGYIEAFRELIGQKVLDDVTDIVCTTGSGGTLEALAVANHLSGYNLGIHGIAVCDDAEYFHHHADVIMSQVGLNDVKSRDIMTVIEGYKGRGYGIAEPEDYEFISRVASQTGIILDPVYTGKAARGLVQELNQNPKRFKGDKILFIHTGGIFGSMDGSLSESAVTYKTGNLYMWTKPHVAPWC